MCPAELPRSIIVDILIDRWRKGKRQTKTFPLSICSYGEALVICKSLKTYVDLGPWKLWRQLNQYSRVNNVWTSIFSLSHSLSLETLAWKKVTFHKPVKLSGSCCWFCKNRSNRSNRFLVSLLTDRMVFSFPSCCGWLAGWLVGWLADWLSTATYNCPTSKDETNIVLFDKLKLQKINNLLLPCEEHLYASLNLA